MYVNSFNGQAAVRGWSGVRNGEEHTKILPGNLKELIFTKTKMYSHILCKFIITSLGIRVFLDIVYLLHTMK